MATAAAAAAAMTAVAAAAAAAEAATAAAATTATAASAATAPSAAATAAAAALSSRGGGGKRRRRQAGSPPCILDPTGSSPARAGSHSVWPPSKPGSRLRTGSAASSQRGTSCGSRIAGSRSCNQACSRGGAAHQDRSCAAAFRRRSRRGARGTDAELASVVMTVHDMRLSSVLLARSPSTVMSSVHDAPMQH